MPKPRGKWAHDDHLVEYPKRRVSFKQTRGGGGGNKYNIIRHLDRFEDTGFDLRNIHASNRHNGNTRKFSRGGRNRSGSPAPQKRLFTSALNWYRVNIPYGGKYDKSTLMKKLLDNLNPLPLIPYLFTVDGRIVHFYVEDYKVAEKLYRLNKDIEMPDGFKLIIRVQADMPNVDVNAELREKIKVVMAKRYNSVTKALDMTKFHADADLQEAFCPLFKPVVSLAVVNIIQENIPELEALSLNDNSIQILSHLKDLPKKMPHLKILHLARNKLKNISHLDNFTSLPLTELVLTGNPLCENYKDEASYNSEIRKRFPKLEQLDGITLPPPISFDVGEVSIPASKQTFLVNQGAQELARQFLEEFFKIMDTADRKSLMQAYHPNVMLSITMSYAYGQNPKNSAQLNWYSSDNRNLERVTDPERRRKLLKQGQIAVLAFIQEMPQSQHDMNSLTVDLPFFSPTMMVMNVTGIFKELRTGRKLSPLRYFFRTFVIVPNGTGFCITNEELHITNATESQAEHAFANASPIVTPAVAAPAPPQYPVASTSTSDTVSQDMVHKQMIDALRMETGMNADWATKCLQETNWSYDLALYAYNEAKRNGTIPPDAFVS